MSGKEVKEETKKYCECKNHNYFEENNRQYRQEMYGLLPYLMIESSLGVIKKKIEDEIMKIQSPTTVCCSLTDEQLKVNENVKEELGEHGVELEIINSLFADCFDLLSKGNSIIATQKKMEGVNV